MPADAIAHALALLQQSFLGTHGEKSGATDQKDKEPADIKKLEKISKISKPNATNENLETSAQGEKKDGNGKQPYCYRCLTKGHAMKDIKVEMHCEICDCEAHVTER